MYTPPKLSNNSNSKNLVHHCVVGHPSDAAYTAPTVMMSGVLGDVRGMVVLMLLLLLLMMMMCGMRGSDLGRKCVRSDKTEPLKLACDANA